MTTSRKRSLTTLAAAAAVTLLCSGPARADDTELFVGAAVAAAPSRPNILFIMDTSGSMDTDVTTQVSFDPADTYSGSCNKDRIYWSTDDKVPSCSTDRYVKASVFTCNAAQPNLASAGIAYVTKAARWRSSRNRWESLSAGDDSSWIECSADEGVHGQTASSTKKFAADGSTNGPWSSSSANKIDWSRGQAITFYSGNYLNWKASPTITRTRLEIMQEVLTTLLTNLDDNVNVGLMRYSNDTGSDNDAAAQGGMVMKEMGKIEDNRASMITEINSWSAAGWTPLSETLFEATQYFRGDKVYFAGGENQTLFPGAYNAVNTAYGKSDKFTSTPNGDSPSITASRNATDKSLYDSPADQDCQKNYIVYLTDGLPTQDNEANTQIEKLPNFAKITGAAKCDGTESNGKCTDDLAKWLHQSDLRADRPGVQNVSSYWIGFGDDVKSGTAFLEKVAQRGGGKYYAAEDTAQLTEAFSEIISKILEQTTTFTSPTVAVNAFNRTQNLNYLYMSVFKPATSYRWLGNIKKYQVTQDGEIRDVNGNSAVDPNNGFFEGSSQSFWSDMADGADAELGGAAGELKNPTPRTVANPTGRKIYSNLTVNSGALTEDLSALKSNLTLANLLLLGVVDSNVVSGRPATTNLVDWAYGQDVLDENGNGDTAEARKDMGDPLHSRPATVIYGGPADDPDLTLYATTNDGYLQAINAKTGEELWAFVPRLMLNRIEKLYENDDVTSRIYGLDGAVRVVRLDRDGDGTIEPAGSDINGDGQTKENEKDKVYLFFGMRRGGNSYIGLDVTDRDAPKLLWTIGASQLPGVGQTWSAPAVARVNVDRTWSSSNPDKMVLVFGGGYDIAQDTVGYVADTVGRQVFMVDAVTGSLIWRAGPTSDTTAQLQLAKMTNSIPGDVRVVDLSGDGFADRMYAADMGGRVWRFDIRNGQTPANLVYGGVFASLGNGDLAVKTDATKNRRFFYAPDVSLMKVGTTNFINVGIGSGHREKPITDVTVVNRFYSLRDFNVFSQVQNTQYKATCGTTETSPCHQIITDGDSRLLDVSADMSPTIPTGGVGWRMDLQDVGDKVLAESRTFQNRIYFTTYSPQEREYNPEYCVATVGLNRLYVVDAATGKPVVNFSDPTSPPSEIDDRFKELAQGSIAPEAIFVFPTPDADEDNPNPPAVPPICLVGLESCGTGLTNPPVRTYWEQRGSN
jgi:type IV pilus assembly protein PilY1